MPAKYHHSRNSLTVWCVRPYACLFCLEDTGLGQNGRRILRVADTVRPGHDRTGQVDPPVGAWSSHSGGGHSWASWPRLLVDDSGDDAVYDEDDDRAQKRRLPGIPQSDKPPDAVHINDHEHREVLLLRRASRQHQPPEQSTAIDLWKFETFQVYQTTLTQIPSIFLVMKGKISDVLTLAI